MVVYKITNLINNKVYIGITTIDPEKRKKQHFSIKRSGCPRLVKAFKKYGIENFEWKILDQASTIQELTKKEVNYIFQFKSNNPKYGYNILSGGFTNEGAIESRKTEIYDAKTGEVFDSIKKASEFYNIPKEQISLQLRGRQNQVHGFSFKYLDKQKQISIQEKIRHRKIKSKFRKPILCVELGKEFYDIKQLSKAIGFCRNTIGKALNGGKTKIPYTLIRVSKS